MPTPSRVKRSRRAVRHHGPRAVRHPSRAWCVRPPRRHRGRRPRFKNVSPRPRSAGHRSRSSKRTSPRRRHRRRDRSSPRRRHNRIPPSTPRRAKRTVNTISHDAAAQRFTLETDGSVGELDYTLKGDVMTITHTRVPPAIRGRGVAAELMSAALAAARGAGWSVNPACSYAAAYMAKQTEGGRQHVEDLLDEALDESFPASDSPAVGGAS